MSAIDRRALLLTGLAAAALPAVARAGIAGPQAALAALEARSGGRLGVAILDGKTGALIGHRQDERFTMCSTFKLSLAAAILSEIDAGRIAADASLPIGKDDPVGHSPAVRAALEARKTALPILDLAQAAQTVSDNGAANILLRKLGGPEALTRYWRRLGDRVTRLDHYEPELNTSRTGDPRDTSSAAAMARTMRALFTGPALTPAARARLAGWTLDTQTGLKRLRGGLPADWRAGDKTGTNMGDGSYPGKVNDLAIVWHPRRAEPFLIAAFLEPAVRGGDTRPQDEAVLADVGRIAADWIAGRV